MTTQNLTDWFNLSEQKPWEPGVYAVDGSNSIYEGFAYWDGEEFGWICVTKDSEHIYRKNGCKVDVWRGLSSDPNAKPAPEPKPKARGNRKVTRYVVMAQNRANMKAMCDGVFKSKDLAIARMEQTLKIASTTHILWVQKVRFRTPEAD